MNKSICVFCGARSGNNTSFVTAAIQTGNMIAKNKWRLVYGAGDVGLMGAVASSTQENGGTTFGVIPEHLLQREVGKRDLDQLIITDNMHSRKQIMFTNSDAVVLLPGGVGSLEEFFEVLTWAQLKIHHRPIIVLNIRKYWQPMLSMIDHMITSDFANPSLLNLIQVVDTVTDAERVLRSCLKTATE